MQTVCAELYAYRQICKMLTGFGLVRFSTCYVMVLFHFNTQLQVINIKIIAKNCVCVIGDLESENPGLLCTWQCGPFHCNSVFFVHACVRACAHAQYRGVSFAHPSGCVKGFKAKRQPTYVQCISQRCLLQA